MRKNVILWGLLARGCQECDSKGFVGRRSVRRTLGGWLTLLILRTWGAGVLRPYTRLARAVPHGRGGAGFAPTEGQRVSANGDSNWFLTVTLRGDAFGFEHFVFGFDVVELGLEQRGLGGELLGDGSVELRW